jgi:hypothetical protein
VSGLAIAQTNTADLAIMPALQTAACPLQNAAVLAVQMRTRTQLLART